MKPPESLSDRALPGRVPRFDGEHAVGDSSRLSTDTGDEALLDSYSRTITLT